MTISKIFLSGGFVRGFTDRAHDARRPRAIEKKKKPALPIRRDRHGELLRSYQGVAKGDLWGTLGAGQCHIVKNREELVGEAWASYEPSTKTGGLGAVLVDNGGSLYEWFGLQLNDDACKVFGSLKERYYDLRSGDGCCSFFFPNLGKA